MDPSPINVDRCLAQGDGFSPPQSRPRHQDDHRPCARLVGVCCAGERVDLVGAQEPLPPWSDRGRFDAPVDGIPSQPRPMHRHYPRGLGEA
jgi:hypothetical protein